MNIPDHILKAEQLAVDAENLLAARDHEGLTAYAALASVHADIAIAMTAANRDAALVLYASTRKAETP